MFYGSFAQTRTIQPGSIVINMGVVPQSYANGLKPYGLIYNLLDIQKVPVLWSINPSKLKDGIDFSIGTNDFKGGTFVLESQYASLTSVQTAIASFVTQGVVIYTTTVATTIPLYKEIKTFPKWVFDTANGPIAIAYLTNAGIPATAYRTSLPSAITTCDDLFILPHADPTWKLHGKLFAWNNSTANGGNAGWLWVACHAVSVLEGVFNPANPSETLNFLASNPLPALVPFGSHGVGTATGYSYANPTDVPMQFMSTIDAATNNGSERVYLPSAGGSWRPTTKVSCWDSNHPQVVANGGTLSPGLAAKIAYGYAFGDADRGKVMYEGGHNHNTGDNTASVAAQRAMLNFSFDAPSGKVPIVTTLSTTPSQVNQQSVVLFNVSAASPNNSALTYSWTSSCGGSFSNPTSNSTNFTAPTLAAGSINDVNCLITVTITDSCGRKAFQSYVILIKAPPAPPVATNDTYTTYNTNVLLVTPLTNDTDLDNNINPTSLINTTPLSVPGGVFSLNGDGTITFVPTAGFAGTATLNYQICDTTSPTPLCAIATITVNVVASPCITPNIVSSTVAYGSAVTSSVSWNTPLNALGAPNALGSNSTAATGSIVIDLGAGNQPLIGSQIEFRIFSTNASNVTGTIDASTTTTFPVAAVSVSTIAALATPQIVIFTVTQANTRYLKITGINRFGLESITYQKVICVTPSADVSIVKTVNNLNPLTGDTIIFTLSATNNGPSIATNTIVTDNIPAGYTVQSVVPTTGTWTSPNWTIGNLASGSTTTMTVTATVNAAGPYANTAIISAAQTDNISGNNSSTSTPTPSPRADLSIFKSVNNASPTIGNDVTFTLFANNNGPSAATGISVTDILPSGYTFVSATQTAGTYNPITGIWLVGNLANNSNASLNIIATVNGTGNYTNTANVIGSEADTFLANNTSSAAISCALPIEPTVSSVTQPTCAVATGTIVFAAQSNVEYSVDGGLNYQASTTFSNLPFNIYNLFVRSTLNNSCSTPANASITITKAKCTDLKVTKVVNITNPNVGSNVTFTITASNNGPDPATGVKVNDLLPSGYTFVSATPSIGSYDNITGVWLVGNLGLSQIETLLIVATVLP